MTGYAAQNIQDFDYFSNFIREIFYSLMAVKHPLISGYDYFRKKHQSSKVKNIINQIESMSIDEKEEFLNELIRYTTHKKENDDLDNFRDSITAFNENSKYSHLILEINEKYKTLNEKEKMELILLSLEKTEGLFAQLDIALKDRSEKAEFTTIYYIGQVVLIGNKLVKKAKIQIRNSGSSNLMGALLLLLIYLAAVIKGKKDTSSLDTIFSYITILHPELFEAEVDPRLYGIVVSE